MKVLNDCKKRDCVDCHRKLLALIKRSTSNEPSVPPNARRRIESKIYNALIGVLH